MRMTEDQWDTVINVNLKGVFNMTQAVSRSMLKARKGSIITLSSVLDYMEMLDKQTMLQLRVE